MVIPVKPLPSDVESDEWIEDSHRISEENKIEMKHENHIDGLINTYGSVEEYMKHLHPEYTYRINHGTA